ncbi:MAG: Flagellar hook-length control protein FliK [Chlamydiales bacterium]|jgi:flagellar hook-length control protein FliK|nr:Flagellar hook-length control protein FliK [Chlamydiales bacterium]
MPNENKNQSFEQQRTQTHPHSKFQAESSAELKHKSEGLFKEKYSFSLSRLKSNDSGINFAQDNESKAFLSNALPLNTSKRCIPKIVSEGHSKMEELRNRVLSQVEIQLKISLREEITNVKLRLQPSYLGWVKIQLQFSAEKLCVTFVVDNQSAKELLQRSADALQKVLLEKGFPPQALEITFENPEKISNESLQPLKDSENLNLNEGSKKAQLWTSPLSIITARIEDEVSEETYNVRSDRSDVAAKTQVVNIVA